MNKVLILFLAMTMLFSCSDFLEEETVGIATPVLFDSEAGVEQLANGAYNTLRFQFNGEQSFFI